MTTTDYLINGLLVAMVVLQLRGRRLTIKNMLLPLGLVAYVAMDYLHSIPTAGNDLVLAIGGGTVGLVLGTGAGTLTRVFRNPAGDIIAKATGAAAALWVLGIGSRIAFSLYTSNGGGAAIVRFSAEHHITSLGAWVACLILMAVAEALSRTAVIAYRAYRLVPAAGGAPATGSGLSARFGGGIMAVRER